METPKNFLYFLKRKLFLYSRNGNPEKIPYVSGIELSYVSGRVYSES